MLKGFSFILDQLKGDEGKWIILIKKNVCMLKLNFLISGIIYKPLPHGSDASDSSISQISLRFFLYFNSLEFPKIPHMGTLTNMWVMQRNVLAKNACILQKLFFYLKVDVNTHTHIHSYTSIHVHTNILIHTHTHIYTYTHIDINTYTHTYTHIHIYTYT